MLSVQGLSKSYQAGGATVEAVRDVSFRVGAGEVVTLLGPSGCGKTTVLRCVAGLERPDAGEVEIAGATAFSRERRVNVPTPQRPIAMVFQSYAIWPHMSVFDNVAYPLRVGAARPPRREVAGRVTEALEMVRIPELASRAATALSGGQQQRVALARALVRRPQLLLLDEPLSNLDTKLRLEMRTELQELFAQTGVSTLYVTHDLAEALVLSRRIVVMDAGRVLQEGTPQEVYQRPSNAFVADFMGASVALEGTVRASSGATVSVDVGVGVVACPPANGAFAPGDRVLVVARPEGVTLDQDPTLRSDGLAVPCVVESVAFLGPAMEYRVQAQGRALVVRSPAGATALEPGQAATLHIAAESCVALPAVG